MAVRILHLTLLRKWFDEIATGRKVEEYREIKPYWADRLLDPLGNPIQYDEVHFRNGYSKTAPFMRVEWKGLRKTTRDESPTFAIQLGRRLEIRDWTGEKK